MIKVPKKQKEAEVQDSTCDRKVLYPYVLYDDEKRKIDCIFYAECCNQVVDDEYMDGRMTWEPIKTEWTQTMRFPHAGMVFMKGRFDIKKIFANALKNRRSSRQHEKRY